MFQLYTPQRFDKEVQQLIDRGFSRRDALAIIRHQESQDIYRLQRFYADEEWDDWEYEQHWLD